jgi:hypothetical protein
MAAQDLFNFNMLNSFLSPEKPYKEAGKAEEQGWNQAQDYQRPYWQHGNDQYEPLNQARQKLMDPTHLQDEWGKSYEQSPYAKRMLEMNTGAGMDAASAMGLGGSSAAIQNIQQGAGDIVSKDRREYMDDMMKKYMAGIGLGENMYGTGAQTGANLGNQATQHGANMAGIKYGESAAPGALYGKFAGAAANYAMPGSGNTFNS